MFLKGGKINGTVLFGTNASFIFLENALVCIAILMIPIMLLVKPVYLNYAHKDSHQKKLKIESLP